MLAKLSIASVVLLVASSVSAEVVPAGGMAFCTAKEQVQVYKDAVVTAMDKVKVGEMTGKCYSIGSESEYDILEPAGADGVMKVKITKIGSSKRSMTGFAIVPLL
ncbi:hypothetical protein WJT86_03710 [Microvirga sp. W0021]|uniref:Secreted protein n=1 Tax=Hohaiivirga grylli TaxID=3133970 RepID=A0ABV0BIT8_9HYPH